MLKLLNIKKDYKIADGKVHALKGISLSFRENEFVAVLGPSGCGKTTLLNIIGGLDRYTDGDMFINGISTKNFTDRDFDVYRNHQVGFVFQSYNLIPHQTVLGNVELSLTIAGISKEERIQRAKEALDKVGLSDQYYKKPNQLSGGQSQRVAIARALVNDPKILLADEPTGALDTKTSVQIMDLIKEIAKERLVIMVTHNAELANQYANRIVNLLDGELLNDSNVYSGSEHLKTDVVKSKDKKVKHTAKMSWWTSFKLSLQNLFSKKSRTILTSIASSIGIMGITLVLSLSYGLQTYIDDMQDDMLSGNPITINTNAIDLSSFMAMSGTDSQIKFVKEHGYINVNNMIEDISQRAADSSNMFVTNNITPEYIDYVTSIPLEHAAAVFLDYEFDISNNLYVDFYQNANSTSQNISLSALRTVYTAILKQNEATKDYAGLITSFTEDFKQAPDNEEYILGQYTVLDGRVATKENEIMLVVNKDSVVSDLLLAQLGYYTQEEFINSVLKATNDERYNPDLDVANKFSYQEIMQKVFTWFPNDTIFKANENNAMNPFTYQAYADDFDLETSGGIDLEIVGILEPKENISYGSLQSGFYYTEALTKKIMETNLESEIVKYLIDRGDESEAFTSTQIEAAPGVKVPVGITFEYSYTYFDDEYTNQIGFVGKHNSMSSLLGSLGFEGLGEDIYTLSMRDLGGKDIASLISIYAQNLEHKDVIIKHLDAWNEDGDVVVNGVTITADEREKIVYSDPLTIIFSLINNVLTMITIALIGFTALSLFVSCVMIAIITYVSVVERVKEIGVIRSLGGRKNDVSNLFIAETAIIGLVSGVIAIAVTYLASFIINIIVQGPVGAPIAILPWNYAIIMILISIFLTVVSGFIPSRSAAKKDPVEALRSE